MPSARIAGTLADLDRQFKPENDSTTGIQHLREERKKRKDVELPMRPIACAIFPSTSTAPPGWVMTKFRSLSASPSPDWR